MVLFENSLYGHFDRIVIAEHSMKHEADMKIESNYYICPKDQYYCGAIHGTKIPRKKFKKITHKKDPIIKSSPNPFPLIFDQNEKSHVIGGLSQNMETLSKDEDIKKLDVLDKLLIFLLRPELFGQVMLAHNSSKFGKLKLLVMKKSSLIINLTMISDSLLILAKMFDRGITPSVISRGNSAMSIVLQEYQIRFLDTFLYIKTSLAKCCSLYGLKTLKGTFPLAANHDFFYESQVIPPFKLFVNDGDSKEKIKEKRNWYYWRKKQPWIFKTEISKQTRNLFA